MQAKVIGHLVYERLPNACSPGPPSEGNVEESGRSPNNLPFLKDTRLLSPDALNVVLLTLKRGQCAASRRIWRRAPESMRQLKAFTGMELPDIYKTKVETLVYGLNCILKTKDLYDKRAFENVSLPPRAAHLIEKGAVGDELIELNMLLLKTTIPGFHKVSVDGAMEALKEGRAEREEAARIQKTMKERERSARIEKRKNEVVRFKIAPIGEWTLSRDDLKTQMDKPFMLFRGSSKWNLPTWAKGRSKKNSTFWLYKDCCVEVNGSFRDNNERALLVKEAVMKREKRLEGLKGLVDLEAKIKRASREPIPDDVRLFVWRRDGGQCVRCGSNENLEFDHIIPVSKGGSSSERNLQLLCEKCNRAKSDAI